MSSEIIARYCDKIGQQSQDVSTEELKLLSDCIIQELNKLKQETNNDSFIGVIHEILARMTITDTIELVNIFAFDLELLTLFRDTLTSLFNKCNNNENLNEQETIVFKDIISIFLSMINRVNNTNVDILRTLILNEVLIKSIKLYIDNIDKHLNDPNLFAFDILIRGFETLMEKRKELQDDSTVLILLAAIVKCICSTCYIDIFKQFQLDKTELSMKEHFLLLTCPHYIVYGYDGKHIEEVQIELCHTMLNRYLEILEQFIPLIKQWSNDLIIQVMSYLTGILQYTSIRELQQKYLNVHLKLIDAIIVILNAPNLLDKLVEGTTDSMSCLIFTAITYLYGLIFHPTFATVIKEKQLTSTFVKLAEISNDEHIQIHTYRILAMIMNENDIKTLANPAKITEVFINFIKCLADNAVRKRVLQNTLISLKNLVQHDQIKDELVKQGAIPLLIQCATETKDDPINIQQYALEILWALTFNEQAPNILKNDQNFMTHIRSLQSCSERGVAKAAEGLIWKLEKEAEYIMTKKEQEEMIETELSRSFMRFRFKRVAKPTIKIEPTNDAHKYDVMISYSHSDKDVCYQIQERLVKDNFRVWLDRDNLYGSQMQEMADAIENSRFVFICMSDTYKQSVYCQSEAHYAYERRCQLIPLKVTKNYRPDGWLGLIISGKVYVDFSKTDFDMAYQKLLTEINRYQGQTKISKQDALQEHMVTQDNKRDKIVTPILVASDEKTSIDSNLSDKKSEEIKARSSSYVTKTDIELWTKDDVLDFLNAMELQTMMPLCKTMDGKRLYKMYKMCESNSDMMFQQLKSELFEEQNKTLPLRIYLQFLDEIKKYLPISSNITSSNYQSVTCSVI